MIPNISIITSLYNSQAHLKEYGKNVEYINKHLSEANIILELLIIANDATDTERNFLENLVSKGLSAVNVIVTYVERESVYASWNRGISVSSSSYIGFWGVDDIRTPEAIIDGIRLLSEGNEIVYFPYRVITTVNWGIFRSQLNIVANANDFDERDFSQKMRLGPFWVTTKEVFEKVGKFDANFVVCGDFEWMQRALTLANFCPSRVLGGTFYVSNSNLSRNTNPRKVVEDNIIRLRYGMIDQIVPADPDLMKTCWMAWGKRPQDPELSHETKQFLWGEGAKVRQKLWIKNLLYKHRSQQFRQVLRGIVDRLGLRSLFRLMGKVKG